MPSCALAKTLAAYPLQCRERFLQTYLYLDEVGSISTDDHEGIIEQILVGEGPKVQARVDHRLIFPTLRPSGQKPGEAADDIKCGACVIRSVESAREPISAITIRPKRGSCSKLRCDAVTN